MAKRSVVWRGIAGVGVAMLQAGVAWADEPGRSPHGPPEVVQAFRTGFAVGLDGRGKVETFRLAAGYVVMLVESDFARFTRQTQA